VIQWAKAYFIAWPVGAATAFFIMPSAPPPHGPDRRIDRWSGLIVRALAAAAVQAMCVPHLRRGSGNRGNQSRAIGVAAT
jgi:hypothetical protein